MANKQLVFVYGTLKKRHGNHRLLQNDGVEYMGRAVVTGRNRLVTLGAFPGVVRLHNQNEAEHNILGEVYNVDDDTFASLDVLEGCNHSYPASSFYSRLRVDTPYGQAWMYHLPSSYLTERNLVDTIGWRESKEEKEWLAENGYTSQLVSA